MNSLAIVILGRSPGDNRLNYLLSLGGFQQIHEIPFIKASLDSDWISWENKKSPDNLGIGTGAAGCYLGHLAAWNLCVKHGYSAALILEDDAELTKYGKKHLRRVVEDFLANSFNIVHLGNDYKMSILNPLTLVMRHGVRYLAKDMFERLVLRFQLPKYSQNDFPFSSHAYLISDFMAVALTASPPNFLLPVDVLLNGMSQVRTNKVFRSRNQLFVQDHQRRNSQVDHIGR
jgi:GR25 family glycosyltransferase involved in LPS biosynthesis